MPKRKCSNKDQQSERQKSSEKNLKIALRDEPSDFQREIIQLGFEDFVSLTNIKEIIQREHKKLHYNHEISDEAMNKELKYYFKNRLSHNKWFECGLKHLKYLVCECKRQKREEHKGLQVVLIGNDSATQCSVDRKDSEAQCDLKLTNRANNNNNYYFLPKQKNMLPAESATEMLSSTDARLKQVSESDPVEATLLQG